MLSALKSDFYLMKSTIRYSLIAQILIVCLAIISSSQSLYLYYPILASMIIIVNLNSQVTSGGFAGILLSSPLSRTNIVLGRYLFTLSCGIPIMLLSAVVMFIAGDATAYETIRLIIICCTFIITSHSVITPITYIVKRDYVGMVFVIICLIPVILGILLKPVIEFFNFDIDSVMLSIEKIYNSLPALTIILLVSLVLLAISIIISTYVFKKKEF